VELLAPIEILRKIVGIFKKGKAQPSDENLLRDLQDRISKLEKRQQELEACLLKKEGYVENIVVERLYADKVEFNLDAIDVKELSGILSIGLNYEGKLIKRSSRERGEPKENDENASGSGEMQNCETPRAKVNLLFGNSPLSNN